MPTITPATTPDQAERWLSVVGYEGLYEVSDQGRVRSLPRKYLPAGRVLKPQLGKPVGYWQMGLSKHGRARVFRVHRLVLEAFCGPCPPGLLACHGPAGIADNSLANLSWGTPGENMADKHRDGTWQGGERAPGAKLTVAEVVDIYRRCSAGEFHRVLAAEYEISRITVTDIMAGRTWHHVTSALAA